MATARTINVDDNDGQDTIHMVEGDGHADTVHHDRWDNIVLIPANQCPLAE